MGRKSSGPRTCARTLLVETSLESNPEVVKRIYVFIDTQSDVSFIDHRLENFFNVKYPVQTYKMFSAQRGCSIRTKGFQVTGLTLRGIVSGKNLHVPFALSCSGLLDTRHDASTPDTVTAHAHLALYARKFPEFDESAHNMVLLGRDCGEVMAARLLSEGSPYLYDTPLGLALVGSVCLTGKNHSSVGLKRTKYCNTLCTRVLRSFNKIDHLNTVNNTVPEALQEPVVSMQGYSQKYPPPTTVHSLKTEVVTKATVPDSNPREVCGGDKPNNGISDPCTSNHEPLVNINSNLNDENNIINPCFHTLCTTVEPQLITPVFVQAEFQSLGSNLSRDDVFALHCGEASNLTLCNDNSLDRGIFVAHADDEQPGQSQHDQTFLNLINREVSITEKGNIQLPLSVQRALGVVWDTKTDTFSPSIITEVRPFTKHGILATVNTLGYDPAGLISPVTLLVKLFQREILPCKKSGSRTCRERRLPLP